MRALLRRPTSLSLLVLGAGLAIGIPQASAQNFFQMLFGGDRVQRYEPGPPRYEDRAPRAEAQKPRPVAKISGPTYRAYKADTLARVDFSPTIAAPAPVAFTPSLQSSGFVEAKGTLADFSLYAEKDVAKALNDYYSRHPEFIWVSGFDPNARAREALQALGDAASYGLTAEDYAVHVPQGGYSPDDIAGRLRELVRFEVELSARVLRYVLDATSGRVVPDRMSEYYDLPRKAVDLADTLDALAKTYEVKAFLEARHPEGPEYQALRVELESLHESAENDILVDPKLLLKPGESSPEFPKILTLIERKADDQLRAEFGGLMGASEKGETYSQDFVELVKAVQKANGLKPDGVIGARTVRALAGESKAGRIGKVILALEERRWLPRDLGDQHVFINQPAYMVSFTKAGTEQFSMRVVVGRPANQTSFFYDEIEQVDFNPYWGVPRSIIVNEMLPRLLDDPGYLDRAGYEVTDAKGNRIPSATVDWGRYGSKIPYNVRQIPSDDNALGELKILFPNKHAIYMHDTPAKSLFSRDMRAYSHGCVRLQRPREMAAAVLGTTVDAIAAKLKKGHSSERVPVKIPVYVAYFTAWPDQSGRIAYHDDVYGRDARLADAMAKTDAARAPVAADLSGSIDKTEAVALPKL